MSATTERFEHWFHPCDDPTAEQAGRKARELTDRLEQKGHDTDSWWYDVVVVRAGIPDLPASHRRRAYGSHEDGRPFVGHFSLPVNGYLVRSVCQFRLTGDGSAEERAERLADQKSSRESFGTLNLLTSMVMQEG